MTYEKNTRLLKAIADHSRIRLLNALLPNPQCVEELSERLDLAASTVSFHLKKLAEVELVYKIRDQYYTLYTINDGLLNLSLRELIHISQDDENNQNKRLKQFEDRVIRTFFNGKKLGQLPVQKKKQRIVLQVFLSDFEINRIYDESEINTIIHKRYDDHCTIRRCLIDQGMMTREKEKYKVNTQMTAAMNTAAPPQKKSSGQEKDKRRQIRREYKSRVKEAGVWRITNKINGRFLIGSNLDMHHPFNRHRVMLNIGSHRNKALQADWNALGADAFDFEVLETLSGKEYDETSLAAELEKLEARWLAVFKPNRELWYNEDSRIVR